MPRRPALNHAWLLALATALLPLGLCAAEPAPPVAPVPPVVPAPGTPSATEFRAHTILADGSRTGPVWPVARKDDKPGCDWQDEQNKPVAAGQVLRVQLSNAALPTGISQGATTFDGQRVLGSVVAYSEKEGLTLQSPLLGSLLIPAAQLSHIYIQELAAGEDEDPPPAVPVTGTAVVGQQDVAVYRNGDKSASRLFFVADGVAKLKNGDDISTAPLERLSYLLLAAPKTQAAAAHDLLVLLTDGSRITGDMAGLDATQLTLKSSLGVIKIPRPLIHSLWPRSDGFRLLARIPPSAMVSHGQFDVSFPPRINRTTAGQTFQAGEFNLAGIGMHSYTRAGYPVAGATRFTSFVTIDGHAPQQGTCTVRVYVDGTKKLEKELKRAQAGEWISVSTTGGKLLELEVDYGADQTDVGDLVDWINAVLIQ